MPGPKFDSVNTIQMSLQSAEQHLHHNDGKTQLHLSCALINIARGSCVAVVRPDGEFGQSPFGSIHIPADRPVMKAQISLATASFDELTGLLRNPTPRPVTLVMTVEDRLSVSQDGLLFIDVSLDTAVTDIYWSLPIK
tara:strand:- start:1098 stop:1511 length:414 start_codon:yes stop_codon:yes gene_type:complete